MRAFDSDLMPIGASGEEFAGAVNVARAIDTVARASRADE
jgi:hypothetical protein